MTSYWSIYFVKVSLFHGICYLLYWFLLRKQSLFKWNRFYLVTTLLLGLCAPMMVLPGDIFDTGFVVPEANIIAGTFVDVQQHGNPQGEGHETGTIPVLWIAYVAITVFLAGRSILGVKSVFRLKERNNLIVRDGFDVVRIDQSYSFSFIKTIFLRHDASDEEFLHEKGHVAGAHWLDLIFVELICLMMWMNPFAWLYRTSLKQQHEYLADQYVLTRGTSIERYLNCILSSISNQEPIGPVHKFNSQSLKQRIVMITKDQFSRYSKFVYIAIIPVLGLLLFSFSERPLTYPVSSKVFVIDAAHGGSDLGASLNGLQEKDIALSVAKLVRDIGKEKGLNVQLTRNDDRELTLQERVKFATEAKADMFLSLHLGSHEGGLVMHVSDQNKNYGDSKRMVSLLSSELKEIEELSSPVVQNSGAYVLKNASSASAILEMGSLADDSNAKYMSDPANQKRVAIRIVNALMKY